MTKKVFITGTDTGIGKTQVSCILLNNLSKLGFRVSGYKPVSTGCKYTKNGIRNKDVCSLMKYSNIKFDYDKINPFSFISPTSPNIASERENKKIDVDILSKRLKFFINKVDFLIIEGIGGWLTPLNGTLTISDWVKYERIPTIMVVGMRLGCINHALLTALSIKQKKIKLIGWIANQFCEFQNYQIIDYIHTLKKMIYAPMIGTIPYLKSSKKNDFINFIDLSYFN